MENLLLNVKDNPTLKRDASTGAILINDETNKRIYEKRKEKRLETESRLNKIEDKQNILNSKLDILLDILQKK